MRFLITLSILALVGCASLPENARELPWGSRSSKALEELGDPQQIQHQSDGSTAWYYADRHDACVLKFKSDHLIDRECIRHTQRPSGGEVAGALLKGMGDGLKQSSSSRSISCFSTQTAPPPGSNVGGGTVYTNCY